MARPRQPLERRFWKYVAKGPDCWNWVGSTRNGYGTTTEGGCDGRLLYAHRVSYMIAFGEIPSGLVVHHRCGNQLCVNPAHLEPLTCADHKREHPEIHDRPHACCKQGHPYTHD